MRSVTNSKGFTLIELMIVIAIIGILASVVIDKYQGSTKEPQHIEMQTVAPNPNEYFEEEYSEM